MGDKKKIIFVIGFYLISFVVTLLVASQILNYERTHPSRNQGDTSLVRLYVRNSGLLINEMDGYTQQMNAAYLRGSITPVSENKTITLQFAEPESNVATVRYSLMDENNAEEIESGECPEIQRVEGQRQTQIVFNADLQSGKEYCLNLTVEDDADNTCYYYTRVLYGNDLMAYDKLQFAMDFHNATFEKTAASRIAEYLTSATEGVSDDFRRVTIASDSETITWGNLNPEIVGDVQTNILNLDSQNGEIQMVYEIVARDDSGNDYNYMVKEYYSVSSTGSTVDLLDYSRTMEEKLDNQSFVFDNNQLRLGMVDENKLDVQVYGKEEPVVEESETGEDSQDTESTEYNTYISFVADGGLWVYNTKDNILTQAFGFERRAQGSLRAASYLEHGVKVLRTEENGDLYFAVYGYVYNGDNEGRFGIEVNHYNRADGNYSEVLFIPYDKNFTMLNRGIQKMAFMDDDNMLYLCLEDTIYQFDVVLKEANILLEQAESENCAIADDGHSLVVSNRDASNQVSSIEWRNLETGESQTIESGGQRIQMIGMLGENLVYGVGTAGNETEGLDVLYIVDFQLNVLKEYRVEGGYISDVAINGDLLEISRKNTNNGDMPVDYILYNQTNGQTASAEDITQEVRMKETWLTIDEYGNTTPVVLFARAIEAYRNTQMDFTVQTAEYTGFYVYEGDNLFKYPAFKEAYQEALAEGGKILDGQGKIIGRPVSASGEADLDGYTITLAESDEQAQQKAVLEWIMDYENIDGEISLSASGMFESLEANLPDFHIVDMSGMALNDALPMITEGKPLVVKNSEGTWCVIEGYKNGYIVVADPKDGTVSGYEWDSAVNGIGSSGNVIYSYYK